MVLLMLYFRRTAGIATLLIVLLLSGCVVSSNYVAEGARQKAESVEIKADSVSREDKLSVRVQNRWNALIARDFAKAYEFNSPGYKGLHTLEQFKGGFGGQVIWTDADVARLEAKGDAAKVVVMVKYKAVLAFGTQDGSTLSPGETALHENWILEDEVWYYVPR